MKLRSFAGFVGPSVFLMLALLALPMLMTVVLSMRNCALEMELVTVQQTGPFGAHEVTTQRAKVDASGQAVQTCQWVGLEYYRKVLGLEKPAAGAGGSAGAAGAVPSPAGQPTEFFSALRFTLLYVAATTPFVLGGGLALALAMNRVTQRLKAVFIAASLLPFIITPVVGALAIKWLFRDNGLVPHVLGGMGIEVFWMAQAWSAQLLVILYGIWHVLPFAFIVFYAGLQGVPQDALEAATIDGATNGQKLRYVTLPHLMPLVVFVLMMHLMDAYRVFEPVMVLTQGAFTTSVQYLTYHVLLQEDNPYKASAASVLTIIGIALLLIPLLRKTWREQRQGH
ncbi:MAG: carbohydrate ABC transporter permease [Rubrivivax sp.]|jgi:multiple sugar transport system permease protein|nr:sugar ABC transporter permease [Rubrivivax sp.]